jgi:hypothetical protein
LYAAASVGKICRGSRLPTNCILSDARSAPSVNPSTRNASVNFTIPSPRGARYTFERRRLTDAVHGSPTQANRREEAAESRVFRIKRQHMFSLAGVFGFTQRFSQAKSFQRSPPGTIAGTIVRPTSTRSSSASRATGHSAHVCSSESIRPRRIENSRRRTFASGDFGTPLDAGYGTAGRPR